LLARAFKLIKNLFSTSKTDDCKKEFAIDFCRINLAKLIISAKTLIALGIIQLIVYCIVSKGNLFTKPQIYFGAMNFILLFAMTIFLSVIVKLEKDAAKNVVSIHNAQIFFINFILLWSGGISLLHQLTHGQTIVYIAAVIITAGALYIEPSVSFLIYFTSHLIFSVLLPNFQKSPDLLFGIYLNTTSLVIMSFAISYTRYKRQEQDFKNRKIMQENSDELKRINKELEEANKKLKIISQYDGLTGIFNRHTFDTKIREEWNRCKRHSMPLSLIMADIDHFKSFNDKFGHQAGDNCLKLVAEILSECAKRSSDVVARYGGEEFVILLPQTERERAYDLAEKMRKRVEELNITISLGVNTTIPSDESSVREFIKNTDKALYIAKNKRNSTEVYLPIDTFGFS
jgi:diguanylate cyclase (GGDEF)-like protein